MDERGIYKGDKTTVIKKFYKCSNKLLYQINNNLCNVTQGQEVNIFWVPYDKRSKELQIVHNSHTQENFGTQC